MILPIRKTEGDVVDAARRRHAIAFGPIERIGQAKLTNRDVNTINDAIINRQAALIPARENLANRFHETLVDAYTQDLADLMRVWDQHNIIDELVADAVSIYNAQRVKTDTEREANAALRAYLDKNRDGVDRRIDSIIRRAPVRGFDGDAMAVRIFLVLFAEQGALFISRALQGQFDSITKWLFTKASATKADEFLMFFTLGEGEFPPLPASAQISELADTIAKRANEVTLKGFTPAMFEEVRSTIRKDLYEATKGGAGAAQIARDLGKDLRAKFGSKLPDEANNRLMLWARTEGAVVQNDALMARGKDAGMNGKVWQTVGDNRVRPAHTSNEGAGVIPVGDTFPDGSTDGGSGSVSPFMCRCSVGPALLSSKLSSSAAPKETKRPTTTTPPKSPRRKPRLAPERTPKTSTSRGKITEDELHRVITEGTFDERLAASLKRNEVDTAIWEDLLSRAPKLTMENLRMPEIQALLDYKGTEYSNIQAFLRNDAARLAKLNEQALADAEKKAGLIKNAFDKYGVSLNEDTTLYRVLRSDFTDNPLDKQIGDILTDKGFMSTSLSSGQAMAGGRKFGADLVLRIHAPKGVNIIPMPAFHPSLLNEREILLNSDTRLRITGISEIAGKRTAGYVNYTHVIDVEII